MSVVVEFKNLVRVYGVVFAVVVHINFVGAFGGRGG